MTNSPVATLEIRRRLSRLPWPTAFILSAVTMLAGPLLLSIGVTDSPKAALAESVLKAAPAWLLIAVGTLVPALEALFWCAAFVEGAEVIAKRPGWGALLGALAYGVVYHRGYDTRTILAATWIAAVINFSYVCVRARSCAKALLWAVGLRWAFVAFAIMS